MTLGSRINDWGHKEYVLVIDSTEYNQALSGKPIYHTTASKEISGEWQVSFKKFSKAKMKRMNLI